MASAKIRYNEDFSEFTIVFPDGQEIEAGDVPDDGMQQIDHEGKSYLAVFMNFDDAESNLEPNTLYALEPLETEIEENCDFEEEDDDEEDEEEVSGEATEVG